MFVKAILANLIKLLDNFTILRKIETMVALHFLLQNYSPWHETTQTMGFRAVQIAAVAPDRFGILTETKRFVRAPKGRCG
jgi:hypothetical protein